MTRNDEKGHFKLKDGDKVLGFAEFKTLGDSAILMPHTEIEEGHEGEGLGSQLAKYVLDDIRAAGKLVVPMCLFIAGYIRKHPEYVDLVYPQQRGVFHL